MMRGIIEDISISKIKEARHRFLRSDVNNVDDLANSINQRGLLQAIVVRPSDEYFVVVAGNRRLNACKLLRWRKIPCHIVELDDKEAFEVSLIENIQRETMNPIDEAEAFKLYVHDFGWGGVSQLAEKLGKSPSYITKRVRLLDLPSDVRDSILNSTMSPSTADELASIKNSDQQSELANLIFERRLSMRAVRQILKANDDIIFEGSIHQTREKSETDKILRSFDKSVTNLRIAMNRMTGIIEGVEQYWLIRDLLMEHRNMLHSQIDLLIKQKRKAINADRIYLRH
jgi:ParB family chromosome partitioning protein